MPQSGKLTPEQRLEIRKLVRDGTPMDEIAEAYGVTPGTVYYHGREPGERREHGQADRTMVTKLEHKAMRDMKRNGKPISTIARKFKRSPGCVRAHVDGVRRSRRRATPGENSAPAPTAVATSVAPTAVPTTLVALALKEATLRQLADEIASRAIGVV